MLMKMQGQMPTKMQGQMLMKMQCQMLSQVPMKMQGQMLMKMQCQVLQRLDSSHCCKAARVGVPYLYFVSALHAQLKTSLIQDLQI